MDRGWLPGLESEGRRVLPPSTDDAPEERPRKRIRRDAEARFDLRNRREHPEHGGRRNAWHYARRQGEHVPGPRDPRNQPRGKPRDDCGDRELLQTPRQDRLL